MTTRNITRLFNLLDRNIATINGTLDYDRITDGIILLADTITDTDIDESVWWMGEFGMFTLDYLISGAYWHYSEWRGGQGSKGYAALCALGNIYKPNMESCDSDNQAYQLLNDIAE